jgi:hypothetical protein
MPGTYAHPADRFKNRGTVTFYRGFSNPGAVFERRPAIPYWRPMFFGRIPFPPQLVENRQPRFHIGSIEDGTSNTILVVEAGEAVQWTKPDDLDASPDKPFPPMGGFKWRNAGFNVLMADGRYRHFKLDIPESKLRALITYNGGENIEQD